MTYKIKIQGVEYLLLPVDFLDDIFYQLFRSKGGMRAIGSKPYLELNKKIRERKFTLMGDKYYAAISSSELKELKEEFEKNIESII